MPHTFRAQPDPETLARRRSRLIIGCVVTFFVLLLLGGIIFYARLTGGPALPPEVRRAQRQAAEGRAPSPQVPPGTPALPAQIEQFKQAGKAGDTRSRTLYISDAELNAELQGAMANSKDLRDAHAYFARNRAYFVGRIALQGREWHLTLRLRPTVSNGAVRFTVESAHVGSVEAPASIVQRIQSELNKKGEPFGPNKTGIYVEQVELQPGLAVLTGRPVAKQ